MEKIICMRGHETRHEEVRAFFVQNSARETDELSFNVEEYIYYIDPITEAIRVIGKGRKGYEKLIPLLTELPTFEEKVEEVEFWLRPFDRVVVRDGEGLWECNKFSHKVKDEGCEYIFNCLGNNWKYCLPFNRETEKLLDTYDDPKTKYIFKGVKSYFE